MKKASEPVLFRVHFGDADRAQFLSVAAHINRTWTPPQRYTPPAYTLPDCPALANMRRELAEHQAIIDAETERHDFVSAKTLPFPERAKILKSWIAATQAARGAALFLSLRIEDQERRNMRGAAK